MVYGNSCKCQRFVECISSKWMSRTTSRSRHRTEKFGLLASWVRVQPFSHGNFQSLSDAYNPLDVERGVREFWLKLEEIQPVLSKVPSADSFSMILPPPNVTGTLHLGHSLTVTIQDVLVRWQRMKGKQVLWIPGLDHAGIATQTTFEKKLWKEKRKSRYDLGRENFEKELWNWKREKEVTICSQLRNMGASMDWSRQYFTLDSKHSETVTEAFIRLFSDGLIYRSDSIVNWCCELQSAISDIEVDHLEVEGPTMLDLPNYKEPVEFGILTKFAYKSLDNADELVVSTTRLETMLGDTAVAVHPNDERYTHWHGAQVWHPFRKTVIPVVCDDTVDPKFGTGVVKVTPAHSLIDYEIGKKHKLEILSVIDEKGMLNNKCGKFQTMKRFDARKMIKDELIQLGHFRDENKHAMSLPLCSRTGDVVEFLLKPQWFLACQEMAKVAMDAVENGKLHITPSSYNSVWFTWLHNIRDWCISRQLWWGHRIPAFECSFIDNAETVWVAAENAEKAKDKAAQKMNLHKEEKEKIIVTQDVDVLDTWFSSALLPFSSLGWPHQTEDMKQFYPLNIMETGHDIIFFWVARMVMLGSYFTGIPPFKKVVLHGIVCDSYGRKMSKSLGNVIDPQDIINGSSVEKLMQDAHRNYDSGLISAGELSKTLHNIKVMFPSGIPECSSDALRFTLCSQNISNVHINFDVNLCHKNRQFCNKIWQACRYIERNYADICEGNKIPECAPQSKFDKWIVSRLAYLVIQVNESLDSEAFHIASDVLKNFIYNEFCSIYLEGTKPLVRACDSSSVRTVQTLVLCMDVALRALSPFMPFLTEHLYQHLSIIRKVALSESITSAPYPSAQEWASFRDEIVEDEMKNILDVVSSIRHMKFTYGITKKDDSEGFIECLSDEERHQFLEHLTTICSLTNIANIQVTDYVPDSIKEGAVNVNFGCNNCIYLKILSKKKDESKELLEKVKRYNVVCRDLEKLRKITGNSGYTTSAPEKVQRKHIQKIASLEAEVNNLKKYQEPFGKKSM